jgi:hypothetical protein
MICISLSLSLRLTNNGDDYKGDDPASNRGRSPCVCVRYCEEAERHRPWRPESALIGHPCSGPSDLENNERGWRTFTLAPSPTSSKGMTEAPVGLRSEDFLCFDAGEG